MKRRVRLLSSTIVTSVILTLLLAGVVLAAVVAVDTFNDGSQTVTANPTTTTASGYATGTSMIGGERDIQVNWLSGSGTVNVEIDEWDSNFLAYSQGPGVTGDALLQWDGSDNSMSLNATGLGTQDLTDNGTNDVMVLRVIANDNPVAITLTVYSNATNWSYYRLDTPGGVAFGDVVDIVIPHSSFISGGGSGASFNSVGAAEMTLDGTLYQGADLSVDLYESTAVRDFGDAPDTYGTTLSASGARHIAQGLRLGDEIDAEVDGQPSVGAVNDNNNDANDEDGVRRDMTDFWTNNATVDLFVTVNGCSSPPCYLNGWIDWNNDGDFSDASEQVLADHSISNGTAQTLSGTVPDSAVYTVGTDVYARFRLCPSAGSCNSVTGETTNGEVEDYYWQFGPNAVTITEFTAEPRIPAVVLAGVALLGVGAVTLFTLARRRKA